MTDETEEFEEVDDAEAEEAREAGLTVHQFDPSLSYGGDPEYDDADAEKEYADGPGVEGDEDAPEDNVKLVVVGLKGNPPVVVSAANNPPITDLPTGPVEGREEEGGMARTVIVGPGGEGIALRHPIEKGPQEGKIGVVDRELTTAGEVLGIPHGVVSHDLNAEGIQPTGEPFMRCPVCGNVNIALHNKARTSAHCPSCLWQSGNLHATPNPEWKTPGVHESDGVFAAAGEVPVGKLDGALDMDSFEAKEGVKVMDTDDMPPLQSTHVDAEGQAIGQDGRTVGASQPVPAVNPHDG